MGGGDNVCFPTGARSGVDVVAAFHLISADNLIKFSLNQLLFPLLRPDCRFHMRTAALHSGRFSLNTGGTNKHRCRFIQSNALRRLINCKPQFCLDWTPQHELDS